MRCIVFALLLCFALSPAPAAAAKKPARFKVKHSTAKHPKPQKIKSHAHGH